MNTKERLKIFVKYKGIGRNKFEESVGISQGYLSSKSPSVGSDIIDKVAQIYPELNIEWVITGYGTMIKEPDWFSTSGGSGEVELVSPYKKIMHVPLVGQYAQAGYLSGFSNESYVETLPTLPVIAEHEGKGNYMCFEVRGDSMNDGTDASYISGDILICREVDQLYWTKKLHFNKWNSFIIIHRTEGIVVKQIIAHDVEGGFITLHSLNPLYEDLVVHLSDVRKIFNVVKMQRDESR